MSATACVHLCTGGTQVVNNERLAQRQIEDLSHKATGPPQAGLQLNTLVYYQKKLWNIMKEKVGHGKHL